MMNNQVMPAFHSRASSFILFHILICAFLNRLHCEDTSILFDQFTGALANLCDQRFAGRCRLANKRVQWTAVFLNQLIMLVQAREVQSIL